MVVKGKELVREERTVVRVKVKDPKEEKMAVKGKEREDAEEREEPREVPRW